jgi:hypothetical protein
MQATALFPYIPTFPNRYHSIDFNSDYFKCRPHLFPAQLLNGARFPDTDIPGSLLLPAQELKACGFLFNILNPKQARGHYSLVVGLVTCYSLLAFRYSLLATRYALLATRYSLIITGYSLLDSRYSLLTTLYTLLLTLNSLQDRNYWM